MASKSRYPLGSAALLLSLITTGCVSYEPRQLRPSLTLSPEQIELRSSTGNTQTANVDFGIRTSVNESDSLSNVVRLPGVRVRVVTANGPASRAGIREGDVILAINGTETNAPDTVEVMAREAQGLEFNFRLRRNTTVLETPLTAQALTSGSAAMTELYRVDPLASRAGYRTELLDIAGAPAMPAARIVEIFPGSPLPAYGFAVGDIITTVNGQAAGSAQSLINTLLEDYSAGEVLTLGVYRNGELREQELKLWDPGRRLSRVSLWPVLSYESTLEPDYSSFTLLDLWLFSVYRYTRNDSEKRHSVLGLINVSSDIGELLEDEN